MPWWKRKFQMQNNPKLNAMCTREALKVTRSTSFELRKNYFCLYHCKSSDFQQIQPKWKCNLQLSSALTVWLTMTIFQNMMPEFKNSLQRGNDKSPRRSKIARFFLFYLQMSRRSLELISVSFQIRSWVEAFITLCRAQVWAGRTKSPFSCHGRSILSTQMPPLQVTYRTRERARGCNKRGNLLAARRHTQLRYVWSREKGSKTQHWDEMKQLSGLNR